MTNSEEPATPAGPLGGEAPPSAPAIRADLIAAIVFIVLALVAFYASWTMPRLEARRIHPFTIPGLVPGILSIALLVCGGIVAIRSIRTKIEGGWQALISLLYAQAARRVLAVLALVLIYTLGLVGNLPFAVATGIFVFAFIAIFELWLTDKPKPVLPALTWAFGLAVVTAIVVTYVFERLFLVRLP